MLHNHCVLEFDSLLLLLNLSLQFINDLVSFVDFLDTDLELLFHLSVFSFKCLEGLFNLLLLLFSGLIQAGLLAKQLFLVFKLSQQRLGLYLVLSQSLFLARFG